MLELLAKKCFEAIDKCLDQWNTFPLVAANPSDVIIINIIIGQLL